MLLLNATTIMLSVFKKVVECAKSVSGAYSKFKTAAVQNVEKRRRNCARKLDFGEGKVKYTVKPFKGLVVSKSFKKRDLRQIRRMIRRVEEAEHDAEAGRTKK